MKSFGNGRICPCVSALQCAEANLLKRFYRGNSVPVLNSRDVTAEQTCALFDDAPVRGFLLHATPGSGR
jgi:hypothetical protein